MATISVCMIVKNEERLLARCLECLKDIADEIIIVDTGSTDATKQIAAAYTDKIFDYEWADDFAAARNFSFSKATMEYIYVADADEIIDEENKQRFLKLKQVLLPEIEIVQMKYCNQLEKGSVYNFDQEYRGKLYKRLRTFTWVDAVHETVNLDPVVFDSDIEIIHKPLESHAKRDFCYYEKLIEKKEQFSKKLLLMYARELFIAGEEKDFETAVPFFEEILGQDRSKEEYQVADCVLARAAMDKGDTLGFFTPVLKEVAENPPAEICSLLGEYYRKEHRAEEAVMWYYNAIFEQESILDIRYQIEIPYEGMIQCYQDLNMENMVKEYKKLYKQAKMHKK